jgi:soluble lytic murein transglycosylase-like protein
MISTLKQVAMAEKLSVPQLQQAVQNGTIESWIGIPMIQERMKDKKEAQAAMAMQQPKQPPIAEQVLMEAAQQGLDALPTNLPQAYATGGIIGYAEGGETDEAYQQYLEDAEEEEFEQYAQAMLNRTPNVEQGLRAAPSMSYGQVQGQQLRAARAPEAKSAYDASGHKYDELANTYAKEIGLPENLGRYMLKKETGGLKNPETARSKAGAYGPAQLMPATAKELGVDITNPEENVKGGLRYLKKMYDRYNGDERLALAAYNAGPGNVDKALKSGKGIAGLPQETRGYVGFAEGGSVKGYAAGDLIDIGGLEAIETDDPDFVVIDGVKTKRRLVEQSAESPWNTVGKGAKPPVNDSGLGGLYENITLGGKKALAATGDVLRYPAAKAIKGVNALTGMNIPVTESDTPFYDKYIRGAKPQAPAVQPTASAPTATGNIGPGNAGTARASQLLAENTPVAEETPAVTAAGAPKTPDAYEELMQTMRDRLARREKDKDQDKWMGLLTAGLGMMGGQSPYASANIGQGALFGLQQYGQSRKQAAAEEAADLKSMLTLQRYKGLDEYYRSKGAETSQQKKEALDLRKQEIAGTALDRMMKQRVAEAQARFGKDMTLMDDKTKAQYNAYIDAIKTDPRYIEYESQLLGSAAYGGLQFKGYKT